MNPREKVKGFYVAANNLLSKLCADGEIEADDNLVDELTNALHEIDDGVFEFREREQNLMINELFEADADRVDLNQLDLFGENNDA